MELVGAAARSPTAAEWSVVLVADWIQNAVPFDVFGTRLDAASLHDIIRSKEAAARPQDLQDVIILRQMLRPRGNV